MRPRSGRACCCALASWRSHCTDCSPSPKQPPLATQRSWHSRWVQSHTRYESHVQCEDAIYAHTRSLSAAAFFIYLFLKKETLIWWRLFLASPPGWRYISLGGGETNVCVDLIYFYSHVFLWVSGAFLLHCLPPWSPALFGCLICCHWSQVRYATLVGLHHKMEESR